LRQAHSGASFDAYDYFGLNALTLVQRAYYSTENGDTIGRSRLSKWNVQCPVTDVEVVALAKALKATVGWLVREAK